MGRNEEAAARRGALGRLDDDGQPSLLLALLDVALDLGLRLRGDHRTDARAGVLRRPHDQAARGLREPPDELIVGRLEHDDARGGRALLPGVVERRHDDLGDGDIQIGVGVDDDRVLASHLGDDLLDPVCGGMLRRLADDMQPHVHGARERDEVDGRVAHQEVADLGAWTGQEVDGAGRRAGGFEQARQLRGDQWRGAGRLDDHRVAGHERCAGHAGENGQGEVPRGDHQGYAAGLIEVDIVLARHPAHAARLAEAQHLAPVVLEKVDGLVDVADGLTACLAGLESHERGQIHRLVAHQFRRLEQHGGAHGRRGVPPRGQGSLRGRGGGFGFGAAAVGDRADHLVRRGRIDRWQASGGVDVTSADAQWIVPAEAAAYGRQRGNVGVAVLTPREVGGRLVGERRRIVGVGQCDDRQPGGLGAEVGRCVRWLDELLHRGAFDERLAQERVVGGVLQQPPHQVGHARDELADRRVLPQVETHVTDGLLDGLAHAVQHLDLEGGVAQAQFASRLYGRRQRAHVVAGERGPHLARVLQHRARQLLVHGVGVRLVREHRDRPALLGGEHRLVVPIGAFDEAQVEDTAPLGGPRYQLREIAVGVAQVSLQDDAGVVVVAELVLIQK